MSTALGVDVGTTHTKVALVDVDVARTLAVASAPTPAPGDLLRVVAELTRRVLGAAPDAPAPAAVGVASMAETGVPVGPDDEPRGDWLRWDGHRAGRQADELAARLGRTALFAATGVRSSAKVPLATWAWLRDEADARMGAAGGPGAGPLHGDGRWVGAADLVVLGLTGHLVTDHTLAGRTGVPARSPASVRGPVRSGTVSPGRSTRGRWRGASPTSASSSVSNAVGRSPGAPSRYAMALVAGSSSAGGAVAAWLAQVAPDDERARLLERASTLDDALVAQLTGAPDAAPADGEAASFVVLPYVHGRQTPAPDAAATLRAVGRVPDDPVAAVRGVLLGAVLHARWMLDAQAALAGAPPTRVLALGRPVTANPAWAALKRWCTPVPVDVVADEEAVAAGAALLAAERAGLVAPAPALGAAPAAGAGTRLDPRLVARRLAAFVTAATAPSGATPAEAR
ncbi:FGGY-family carbohydrate kinase [Cellulomonas sp. CW35]|uniref:FGGY-family carbohydrate kinase n=1 Tax=Cellulomonas sp. CW35 TaxID=3458249 RepID=UPI004033FCDE